MKQMLYILMSIALCGTLYGKQIVKEKDEVLPVNVQKRIDTIQSAVTSNDWITVRKEYDKINWQEVKTPSKVLNTLSKELKGNKDCKDLRKEIKTKYQLLREDDDADIEDNVDVTPIPIVQFTVNRFPAVEIDQVELVAVNITSLKISGLRYIYLDVNGVPCPTVDFNAIAIPGLRFTYFDIITLDPDVLKSLGIFVKVVDSKGVSVVVLRTNDKNFIELMTLWENRYGKQIDFWDEKGNKIIPMSGSVLWLERKALMVAIEAGENVDMLWDAYNEHFQRVVSRRIRLKKQR
jgi:hypothetical protein